MNKVTLYIIDDDEDVVNALTAIFKPQKRYRIRAHTEVMALLEDVETVPPQVILCDQVMPECEGIPLLQLLKEQFPELRGILLTAQPLDEEVMREMMVGTMDLYMAKPWNQVELEQNVARLAREVSKEAAVSE